MLPWEGRRKAVPARVSRDAGLPLGRPLVGLMLASSAWLRRGLAPALIAAAVAAAYLFGLFEPVERALMDTRFRLVARDATGSLVVVAIDPRSLRELSSWPWPRSYHA